MLFARVLLWIRGWQARTVGLSDRGTMRFRTIVFVSRETAPELAARTLGQLIQLLYQGRGIKEKAGDQGG